MEENDDYEAADNVFFENMEMDVDGVLPDGMSVLVDVRYRETYTGQENGRWIDPEYSFESWDLLAFYDAEGRIVSHELTEAECREIDDYVEEEVKYL